MVSHANPSGLRKMLGNLMYQTRPPEETIVLVSGTEPAAVAKLREDFPWASFHPRDDLKDWGHAKRAEGLEMASGDFVGWFNDDDHYNISYIEKMMQAVEGHDAAFCGWNKVPRPSFRLGSSTSGNFIVRTSLARQVGYPSVRDGEGRLKYDSDGHFINGIASHGSVAPLVEEVLYNHNHQP